MFTSRTIIIEQDGQRYTIEINVAPDELVIEKVEPNRPAFDEGRAHEQIWEELERERRERR